MAFMAPVLGAVGGTAGWFGTAVTLASTAASVYSAYSNAQAAKQQAAYDAAVAQNNAIAQKQAAEYQAAVTQNNAIAQDNNAKLALRQAEDALRRGQDEELALRQRVAQTRGTQTAALAARGIDVSSGSALGLISDTEYLGEIDALTIRDNAAREAWGHQRTAQDYRYGATTTRADAALLDYKAQNINTNIQPRATVSPGTAVGLSLLGNAKQISSVWERWPSSEPTVSAPSSGYYYREDNPWSSNLDGTGKNTYWR